MVAFGQTSASQLHYYGFSVNYQSVNAASQLNWVTWSATLSGGALPASLGTPTGATITDMGAFLLKPS
jgi:hypothetical protein